MNFLLLCFLGICFGSFVAAACPGGTCEYCAHGCSCETCTKNTYSDGSSCSSGTSCASCPAGQSSSAGSSTCTVCPTGMYSSSGNSCENCGEGYTSNSDHTGCTECPAGTWNNQDAGSCTSCSAGSYSTGGATSCTPCASGQVSSEGSSSCTECAAGTYAYNGESCASCPTGSTSSAGSTTCTCDPGYSSYYDYHGCNPCSAGETSNGGQWGYYVDCYSCGAGYSSEPGGTCFKCSGDTYSDDQSTSCMTCPDQLCPAFDNTWCEECTVGGMTASDFAAVLILTSLFVSGVYIGLDWYGYTLSLFLIKLKIKKSITDDKPADKSSDNKVSGNPLHTPDKASVAENGPTEVVDEVVTNQPGSDPPTKSNITPLEIKRLDSVDGYLTVIDAPKKHLFSIPFFKVSPQVYGAVELSSQLISFASFIISFTLDPVSSTLTVQIFMCLIYHVIVSWIMVPLWQIYSIHDSKDNDISCEEGGCICCTCCHTCCSLICCQSKMVSRTDDYACSYIPFSLYNLLFMFRHPGKQLNNTLPETLPYFGFGRMYLFMLSINTKGILNLYMFINACDKVFYTAAMGSGSTASNASTAMAVVSMVTALANLKVYAISLVFGLVLLPFTFLISVVFYCPDKCGFVEKLRAKNGTTQFKTLMKFWSYVNKN